MAKAIGRERRRFLPRCLAAPTVVPTFASMYVQVHRPHATKRAHTRRRRKPNITAATGDAHIGDGDAMFGIGTSGLAVDNGAGTRCARPRTACRQRARTWAFGRERRSQVVSCCAIVVPASSPPVANTSPYH